jgi:signal transduction histidine kinase
VIVQSLARRAAAATLLTAAVSSVVLAAASVIALRVLWERHDRTGVEQAADLLGRALEAEVAEDEHGPEGAAREALLQALVPGDRAVVRRGGTLLAETGEGPPVGPRGTLPEGWIGARRHIPGGYEIELVRRPDDSLPYRRLFFVALLVAAVPSCVVGLAVGGWTGRAAARPIKELVARLGAVEHPGDFALSPPGTLPAEAAALEREFAGVFGRLRSALDREAEFARNAAHELRTPLTRIRLRTERAAERAPSACRDELASVTAEVDRLSRLVDALLVLARDETAGLGAAETVNLADLVRASAAAGEREVRLDAPDEALVRGDEELLRLAVDNLLDNARKYAPAGRVPAARLAAGGEEVRLVVETPGVTLGAEERERVFERFYRGPGAREAAPGHGLGLSLARHVARVHRGDVVAEAGGEGKTVFELRLPAWRSLA